MRLDFNARESCWRLSSCSSRIRKAVKTLDDRTDEVQLSPLIIRETSFYPSASLVRFLPLRMAIAYVLVLENRRFYIGKTLDALTDIQKRPSNYGPPQGRALGLIEARSVTSSGCESHVISRYLHEYGTDMVLLQASFDAAVLWQARNSFTENCLGCDGHCATEAFIQYGAVASKETLLRSENSVNANHTGNELSYIGDLVDLSVEQILVIELDDFSDLES
ncbi:hypothetical protein BC832DRAFT_136401 [Gaertneriomyces semiglobifer]|nr:hypothetical protein BC832DRAFT_136401 [Gaertneriomyces semiglobifer]